MKSSYFKDLKKRVLIKKLEYTKIVCIYLIVSTDLSNIEKYRIYINFILKKKKKISFEVKNHCILTQNTRGINRFYGITRMNLKNLINWGFINGVKKNSW